MARPLMVRSLALLGRLLAILWMAALCAAILIIGVTHGMRVLDRQPVVIGGGSMAPALPVGSVAAISAADPRALKAGDVITVRTETGILYTHRVTEVVDAGGVPLFRTKGDANGDADPVLVPPDAVVGVVEFHVPLAGNVLTLLGTPLGALALVSLLGTLLIAQRLVEDLSGDLELDRRPNPTPGTTASRGPRRVVPGEHGTARRARSA